MVALTFFANFTGTKDEKYFINIEEVGLVVSERQKKTVFTLA